ncbi:ABC transporter permease [Terrabacter carboxydivorans]|uniref:ABC transmembrane type-1 domain-containing protein n=1 Tax=Terrabacter carboxydivorans TaxID=619730 RepID=A0ABN3MI92_9MICO
MPGRGRTPSGRRRVAIYLTAAVVIGWFVLPLLPVIAWAIADRWPYPSALPQELGVRGWESVWTAGTARAVASSAALGILVAVAATVLGSAAGRAIGWRLTRHPAVAALLLLSPVALPPFAVAVGLSAVVLRAGIPEPAAVLATLTVYALPYTTYVVAARYTALEPGAEEQARLLGATKWQALRHVTLPALRPAIAAAMFLAFLVGWSDYVVTLVVGGGQLVTLPMLIGAAASGTGNEPAVAALSLLSVLPPLLALLLGRLASDRLGTDRPSTSSEQSAEGRAFPQAPAPVRAGTHALQTQLAAQSRDTFAEGRLHDQS